MRVTSPAIDVKDVWDALVATFGAAGTYGLLLETQLDAPVSGAKADLTTLETRLSAIRAGYLDVAISSRLATASYTAERGTDLAALRSEYTAALATALGAYTAAKAAFIDASIAAIPTVMVGTNNAALASAWTAALATILGNFSAGRIGYLDQLDFALQEAIAAIPTTMVGTNSALLAANYNQFTKGLTEQAAAFSRGYGALGGSAYYDLVDIEASGYLTGIWATLRIASGQDVWMDIVIEVDGADVGIFTGHAAGEGNCGYNGNIVVFETTWDSDYKYVLMLTPMWRFDTSLKVRLYANTGTSVGAKGNITYLTE